MDKKWITRIGIGAATILVLLVVMGSCASRKLKAKEAEEANRTTQTSSTAPVEVSDYDREQIRLIKKYGSAGDGFRWSDDGRKIPLGDPNLNETQVLYTYIRSLATLDFATAEKYSFKNRVIKTVDQFYSSESDSSYTSTFTKNMYKEVLLSIEPISVDSVATFASGKVNVSMTVNILDLSNKEFWREDEDVIFERLEEYRKGEGDSTKAKLYLQEYVYDYWRSEDANKKEVVLNFVLETSSNGGFLVTVDDELDNFARYAEGETVINAINREFQRSQQ